MMHVQPHTQITFEDLSGGSASHTTYSNPYDVAIENSKNDIKEIQHRYAMHRTMRNAQQKAKLLDAAFSGVLLDPILRRVEDPSIEPGYEDPRHCLVLWARPPRRIRELVAQVQQKLIAMAPKLWTMPLDSLHMTALEVAHSKTAPEIQSLVDMLLPSLSMLVNYTLAHRPRLVNPLISFDAQALAISFVPAAGESPLLKGRQVEDDSYSYHHLRRDLYALVGETLEIGSRYVVPSAHLTIARFTDGRDFEHADGKVSKEKMKQFIETIEETNEWLMREYWVDADQGEKDGIQWIVGEEKGLDCRAGTLWYGGGRTVMLGEGL